MPQQHFVPCWCWHFRQPRLQINISNGIRKAKTTITIDVKYYFKQLCSWKWGLVGLRMQRFLSTRLKGNTKSNKNLHSATQTKILGIVKARMHAPRLPKKPKLFGSKLPGCSLRSAPVKKTQLQKAAATTRTTPSTASKSSHQYDVTVRAAETTKKRDKRLKGRPSKGAQGSRNQETGGDAHQMPRQIAPPHPPPTPTATPATV